MTQVVFINGRVVPDHERRNNPSRDVQKTSVYFWRGNNASPYHLVSGMNSSSCSNDNCRTSTTLTSSSFANHQGSSDDADDVLHYDSNSRSDDDDDCSKVSKISRRSNLLKSKMSSVLFSYGVLFVLLSFCSSGGLCSPESEGGNEIQMKIRSFLESHCSKQNETVEQMEFENFISCNPTQAATTFERLKALKNVDSSVRHAEIQKEINKQCDAWPQERSCQKKNFALIQKCFYVKQRFVFYFMLALTDTICKDGDVFIEYWEKGGDVCLQDHLKQLSNEISQCFKQTSTNTTEDLDRNIGKITSCIGEKFRSCGNAESAILIDDLLSDLAVFYGEIKNDFSSAQQARSSSSLPNQSTSSLASTLAAVLLTLMQPLLLLSS